MTMQSRITSFYPSLVTDSKASQIRRLRSECLLSYKLRYFKYPAKDVLCNADKRLWWFFMDDTLPSTHPLNPATFQKILADRCLSLHALQAINYRLWTTIDEVFFEVLTPKALLSLVFSEEELARAAATEM